MTGAGGGCVRCPSLSLRQNECEPVPCSAPPAQPRTKTSSRCMYNLAVTAETQESSGSSGLDRDLRDKAVPVLVYVLAFIAYLFVHQEGEYLHWVSMVFLPLALVLMLETRRGQRLRLADSLASTGLRSGNLKGGLVVAVVLGAAFCGLQLLGSRSRDAVLPILRSPQAAYLVPLALLLMVCTAATTEEFLFRGVLQTRLAALFRSRVAAVLVSATLFSLYHLPYAYLNPRWPSHGDWSAALQASFGEGMIAGVALGAAYAIGRGNLLAPILLHALIDLLPATALIARRLDGPS
jgi:membrane protease YdiL (CAAX protease family)